MSYVAFLSFVAAALRVLLPPMQWWRLLFLLSAIAVVTGLLQFGTIGRRLTLLDARGMIGACIGLLMASLALRVGERLRGSNGAAATAAMAESRRDTSDAALRIALAHCLVGPQDCVTADDGAQYGKEALAMAVVEGVVVLLHDAQPNLPREIASEWRSMARTEVVEELARGAEARRVLDALEVASLRVLSLKGTALAYWLYAHPAQRPRADLDLLVSDIHDTERATRILQSLGYTLVADVAASDSAEFEIALEYRSPMGTTHVVDLHWRLLNHALLTRGFEFADLWDQSQPIAKLTTSARGLGRTHALLHALLHRVANIPHGNHDKLIWLHDIHLLAQGMVAREWSELMEACAGRGIATPVLDGLQASAAMLATIVPDHVIEALALLATEEDWARLGHVGDGALVRAHLGALSWPQKFGWLRRKLFPSQAFMRHRYGVEGVLGLASAYVGRWWVSVRRGLRD